jgi:hypothetical protein
MEDLGLVGVLGATERDLGREPIQQDPPSAEERKRRARVGNRPFRRLVRVVIASESNDRPVGLVRDWNEQRVVEARKSQAVSTNWTRIAQGATVMARRVNALHWGETVTQNMPEQRPSSSAQYEAPRLVVIGAVRDFTFGSSPQDANDHTVVKSGIHP